MRAGALEAVGARERRKALDFLALTKPRVVLMVLVTTVVGYHLGSAGEADYLRLLHALIGTALAAAGTLALNQFLEREVDARMERTRLRPLPDGRLQPIDQAFSLDIKHTHGHLTGPELDAALQSSLH